MKKILLLSLLLCTCSAYAQKYVHVVKSDTIEGLVQTIPRLLGEEILYKLISASYSDGELVFPTEEEIAEVRKDKYFINISSLDDTIQVIKELLDLEGDKRTLCIPVTGHSSISSSMYFIGKTEWVSVQVYALYIIWGLFFSYDSAAYPVLRSDPLHWKDAVLRFASGKSMEKRAFDAYKKWLKKGKGDLKRLKEVKPLEGTDISWQH